ncbi:hypothetical protein APHCR_1544 [Anaplasma phagocytophilum str. CR1007]|nr:hypothetical protein APHCR_1529 [Anaplasma phagocytophilum str. CR1007]KKA00923.1 hypothetical protein APHCR_1544 [Anaplasma phagocytophilum str. CR1007]
MVGTIICTESRFYILRDWLSHYLITSSVFIFFRIYTENVYAVISKTVKVSNSLIYYRVYAQAHV